MSIPHDLPGKHDWTGSGAGPARRAGASRGTNQSGVRLYNERLALSLIRRHGRLPKAEIARLRGEGAETVIVHFHAGFQFADRPSEGLQLLAIYAILAMAFYFV